MWLGSEDEKSGANLTLSWPTGYTGWRLQVQTNSLNAVRGTNRVDAPGSSVTIKVTLPANATKGSISYRLIYQ